MPTDVELMASLAGGDDTALGELMQRWQDRVATFLYRAISSSQAAADLTQETFVKLYQARNRYKPTASFSTYLFSIAANLARNHSRWHTRHPTVALEEDGEANSLLSELSEPGQNPEQAAVSAESLQRLQRAFKSLPDDLREAMSLLVYEDMGYAEIAAIAGCSTKAAETRIYRARQLLKEKLGDLRYGKE